MYLFKKQIWLTAALLLTLTACGGGGGGGGGGTAVNTGVFVDSAVQGLSYSTSTQSGLTNAAGEFKYRDGEVVTFKIGNIEIGSAYGADYLSPLDITNSYLPVDTAASNVARLLQTLDTDDNPDNGITLPANVAALASTLDVNDTAAVEAAIAEVLVSATAAEAHLESTLSTFPPRAVDDLYRRVTIGSTSLADCPNVIDAEIAVSRSADGSRVFDGTITLFGGGQYVFTADASTIRNPTILEDPNHQYFVTLNTYGGAISIFKVGQPSIHTECGKIILTTDTAVNLPPKVRTAGNITTIPTCSYSSTYKVTKGLWAFDDDGFLASDIIAKFTVAGGQPTTLVNPGHTSSCASLTRHMTWNPKPQGNGQGNGGYYCSASNPVLANIPCNADYSWEVTATDNEGLSTTVTGGNSSPFDAPDPVAGSIYQCSENYPSAACDIIINSSVIGSVTSYAAGSCASLTPTPRTFIDSSDIPTANPSILQGNLIVEYGDTSTGVSCMVF
jgi:hypothetical protein